MDRRRLGECRSRATRKSAVTYSRADSHAARNFAIASSRVAAVPLEVMDQVHSNSVVVLVLPLARGAGELGAFEDQSRHRPVMDITKCPIWVLLVKRFTRITAYFLRHTCASR
jgi:hypothetical protein